MSDEWVLVERPEPHVTILRLSRPRVRNALNSAMRDALASHCRAIAAPRHRTTEGAGQCGITGRANGYR